MGRPLLRAWTAGIILLAAASTAEGVITALTPLKKFVVDADFICVAKVETIYADKPAMMLSAVEDLKGKLPFRKLPVHLKGDSEADKLMHVPQLKKRLTAELPLVLFVSRSQETKLTVYAYTNGTWMQFVGEQSGPNAAVLSLTHGEPYLRRTFRGPTAEMRQTLIDGLAGKKRLPNYDEKEAPGFGPEVETK
jgi:hypothetical protein